MASSSVLGLTTCPPAQFKGSVGCCGGKKEHLLGVLCRVSSVSPEVTIPSGVRTL